MWKFSMFLNCFKLYVLFLLASSPSVNSKEILIPRQCAVCLDKDCATGVRIIYPATGSNTPVWVKANSPTGIQNCSMENLKPDAPCKMANGSLAQPADNLLHFEGLDTYGVWRIFNSRSLPCDELNLPPTSTPSSGMCAVCLDKDCATGVRIIYPAGSITAVWVKANSPTGIQHCSMENLKADAPCKMANGSLAQPADNLLHFEGIDTHDVRRVFHSQILPCADLNLPSKPSPGIPHLAPMTKAPIHNTPTPEAPNDSEAYKNGIGTGISIGIIIGIIIGVIICIVIDYVNNKDLIRKCNSCGQGQDGDHRHGNNGVPPDAEDRDEITIQMQPLNAEVANGNVNGVH